MKLLTQKAYAKLRKVSAPYINKLVRQERIVLVRGKVNPRQADKALAAYRPERSKIRLRKNRKGKAAPRSSSAPAPSAQGRPAGGAVSRLTANRAEREGWQAKTAKLEFEKAASNLLPRAEVLEAEQKKNANVRQRFRRLPRAVALRLVGIQSPAEIERILLEAIDDALDELGQDPLGAAAAPGEIPAPVLQTSAETAEVRA